VRPDGTVTRLPFDVGVSPLLALPDGRWLLPGCDPLWRDNCDEPLEILDATTRRSPSSSLSNSGTRHLHKEMNNEKGPPPKPGAGLKSTRYLEIYQRSGLI
jgi:hypothetical protein